MLCCRQRRGVKRTGSVQTRSGRVQRLRAAVPPPGEAKPDWWIICQIAQRLGVKGFDFDSPKPIFNELCQLSPIYGGVGLGTH